MTTRRWTVWLWMLAVVIGPRAGWSQDKGEYTFAPPGSSPKAVESVSGGREIQLATRVVRLDLTKLPAVVNEKALHDRLPQLARTLGWQELHAGLDWYSAGGLDLSKAGIILEDVSTTISEPTIRTFDRQSARFMVGGELPVVSAVNPPEISGWRPFGFLLECVPTVIPGNRVRLDATIEHSRVVKPVSQAESAADASTNPALSVVGQKVSSINDIAFGESVIYVLPSQVETAATVTLIAVTPTAVGQTKAAADNLPVVKEYSPAKPKVLQGVNSDAVIAGSIVLEDNQVRLEATSLSIEIPQVAAGLGVELGQTCALLAVQGHGRTAPIRIILPSVTLEAIKDQERQEDFGIATVTLKVEASSVAREWTDVRQRQAEEKFMLIALPANRKLVSPLEARRILEHAIVRTAIKFADSKSAELPRYLIDVAPSQKTVQIPIGHEAYVLLPTPTGNSKEFAFITETGSFSRGMKQIGGLTVYFVGESVFELESLIRNIEPAANVSVIEVREAALLRGTVASPEQKKAIIEIAEQYYPRVLDQLKVQGTVAAVANIVDPLDLNPLLDATQREGSLSNDGDSLESTRNTGALRLKASRELPSLEELQQLRDEVLGLRRDVRKITELLESPAAGRRQKFQAVVGVDPGKTELRRKSANATRQPASGTLITRTYHVADLVVPLPGEIEVSDPKRSEQAKASPEILMKLIRTTIEPGSWKEFGGANLMEFHDPSLSLVVCATPAVHEALVNLLSQLHKLQDVQVTVETMVVAIPNRLVPEGFNGPTAVRSRVISQDDVRTMVEQWQADRESNLMRAPRVTLFNGQTAWINLNESDSVAQALTLVMSGVASADRKSVRLALGVNGKTFESSVSRQYEMLQDGQYLFVDISDDISAPAELLRKLPVAADSDEARDILKSLQPKSDHRFLLLVSPRVVVAEEEEDAVALTPPHEPAVKSHRNQY